MARALEQVYEANPSSARLRFTVTRSITGADVCALATPLKPWPAEEHVWLSKWVRNERSPLCGIKTTSYAENLLALAEAKQHGCGEAIMANTQGHICEGSGSNVFLVINSQLTTPHLASGCLPGVMREMLLEAFPEVQERPISEQEWPEVTEMFLTSSTRRVQPVATVAGRRLPVVGGNITLRAQQLLSGPLGRI
jgi:branched-chain amino acid aminotransferase